MTVQEVDVITRRIQEKVFRETGVVLTGVGVYSYNTSNEEAARIRNDVQELVMEHGWVLQMHGFFVDIEAKTMRFDVVLSFEREPHVCVNELMAEVRAAFPDFDIQITPDVDLTD
jgi:hypothetical protein